jgi:hypothetical protein
MKRGPKPPLDTHAMPNLALPCLASPGLTSPRPAKPRLAAPRRTAPCVGSMTETRSGGKIKTVREGPALWQRPEYAPSIRANRPDPRLREDAAPRASGSVEIPDRASSVSGVNTPRFVGGPIGWQSFEED